jgi:hypothetical protein
LALRRPELTLETADVARCRIPPYALEFVCYVLEFPRGYVAQFQDPDGNMLQIREGR